MINKIKDFLKKKLKRKASNDFSDQEELLDDEAFTPEHAFTNEEDKTNPTIKAESSPEKASEEGTGNFALESLDDEATQDKPSLKERLSSAFSDLKEKFPPLRLGKVKTLTLPKVASASKDSAPLISPSLSRSIETFLARSTREGIHQAGLVALICSVTYLMGKTTALVLKGAPTLDSAKDYTVSISLEDDFNPSSLGQVKGINIFRTNTGLGGKKKQAADTKCEVAQQSSNLPIKLMNTIVLQDSVKSLASVQVRGGRELEEVRVGDQISNMAKIFKIGRLEILVKNLETGTCESITSDLKTRERSSPISVMSPSQSRQYVASKKMPGIENVGNKFNISKTLLDEKLKDIASILTQARALKIQNPDGSLSFKMTEIDPGGIFPYLGIQEGDIITSINGKPIYDLNEVMGLFGRIKGLDNLSLGIKRDGSESAQDYSIKK